MSPAQSPVHVQQRDIALPDREQLRVVTLPDGAALQHLNAEGELVARVAVSERVALARMLRHGGSARTLTYQGTPVHIGVCRDGPDGVLLCDDIRVPLPKDAAVCAAAALDPDPDHNKAETPGEDAHTRTYGLQETGTIYVADDDRFVVSLIAGYSLTRGQVRSPAAAARAALHLTTEPGCHSTKWFVHDRLTERMHIFAQGDLDPECGDD